VRKDAREATIAHVSEFLDARQHYLMHPNDKVTGIGFGHLISGIIEYHRAKVGKIVHFSTFLTLFLSFRASVCEKEDNFARGNQKSDT
jgi:hypothetical protein